MSTRTGDGDADNISSAVEGGPGATTSATAVTADSDVEVRAYAIKSFGVFDVNSLFRRGLFDIVEHPYFAGFITMCIVLNAIR